MSKPAFYLSVIFCTCTFSLFAQSAIDSNYYNNSIEKDIDKKVDSLKLLGVDTSIQFYSLVEGWPAYADSSGVYDIQYLIWRQDSSTYTQKFINRNNQTYKRLQPVKTSNVYLSSFLRLYIDSIRNEMILPFVYKGLLNGIELYDQIRGTHAKFTFIRIRTKHDYIQKDFYNINLEKDLNGEYLNLNYSYNSQTKLAHLYNLLHYLTGEINWH